MVSRRECIGKSLTDAMDADAKRRVQKREKRILDILPQAEMTFQELANWYLELDHIKQRAYHSILKINLSSFNKVFGDSIVNDITPADLKGYQARRLGDGLAESYVDQEIGAAKRVIFEAAENDKVSAKVVMTFRTIKKVMKRNANSRKKILSREDFKKLLRVLPEHAKQLLATAYYTGMREGEIMGLTWEKVDLDKREIRLYPEDTKDKEARIINIGNELHLLLSELLEKAKARLSTSDDGIRQLFSQIPHGLHGQHVFLFRGKPIKRDIRGSIKTACKLAGIPYGRKVKGGFVFHDLRHTFNTNMRKAGVPEGVIMNMTGHSTREMYDRYDTIDADDRHKAIAQLEVFLKSADQMLTKRGVKKKKADRGGQPSD